MSIERVLIAGPAGRLECMIRTPATGSSPAAAAVLCHPHPLFGGTMHNKVVHAAATALTRAGIPALRFNFRGVGLSEGRHDAGEGERDDVRAALEHLALRFPGLPLILAGYSFGAWVGLQAGCEDPRVAALVGIGMPVSMFNFSFLSMCDKPLALIQGDQDQFGPLPFLMGLAATVPGGANVLPVRGAAHNFAGRLEELETRVAEAIPAHLAASPAAG